MPESLVWKQNLPGISKSGDHARPFWVFLASFSVEGLERDCFPAVKGSNLEHVVMMSYNSELQTESAKIRQKHKIVQVELQVVF